MIVPLVAGLGAGLGAAAGHSVFLLLCITLQALARGLGPLAGLHGSEQITVEAEDPTYVSLQWLCVGTGSVFGTVFGVALAIHPNLIVWCVFAWVSRLRTH